MQLSYLNNILTLKRTIPITVAALDPNNVQGINKYLRETYLKLGVSSIFARFKKKIGNDSLFSIRVTIDKFIFVVEAPIPNSR